MASFAQDWGQEYLKFLHLFLRIVSWLLRRDVYRYHCIRLCLLTGRWTCTRGVLATFRLRHYP